MACDILHEELCASQQKRPYTRYSTDEERIAAKKAADRRKYDKKKIELSEKRTSIRAESGRAKWQRSIEHLLVCVQCGTEFVAKLSNAKYCSCDCRTKASNLKQQSRAIERLRKPRRCKCCGVEFCVISLSQRNMINCSDYCSGGYGKEKIKRKSDHVFDMNRRVRGLLHNALSNKGFKKQGKTIDVLGCDYAFFKAHIERQFVRGMSWERRSEWHIDHIIPLATAKTEEDVLRLGHFTNLRPLWAVENLLKKDKVLTLL